MNKLSIFILIIIISLIITSCEYKVDKTDIYKVSDAIHESFLRDDTTILKQIFFNEMTDISTRQREIIDEIKLFYTQDISLIKTDTIVSIYGKNISYNIEMFYKKSNIFFNISAICKKNSLGNFFISQLYFFNINEICKEYQNEPYCPEHQIIFKSISWTTDHNEKTFTSGKVALQNNTDYDLNYIKFKIFLKQGNSFLESETFLNQTVESYIPIYKGDIVVIDIPQMNDYFTDFKIKKDNLFFDAELIEILPKPESFRCKQLKYLRDEVFENNNPLYTKKK